MSDKQRIRLKSIMVDAEVHHALVLKSDGRTLNNVLRLMLEMPIVNSNRGKYERTKTSQE